MHNGKMMLAAWSWLATITLGATTAFAANENKLSLAPEKLIVVIAPSNGDPKTAEPDYTQTPDTDLAMIARGREAVALFGWKPYMHNPRLKRWLHRIDLAEFPQVQRWYEAIAQRPAVQRGIAVLADRMKIGNPDQEAREALFGRTQLQQGRRVDKRSRKPVAAVRGRAKSRAIGA